MSNWQQARKGKGQENENGNRMSSCVQTGRAGPTVLTASCVSVQAGGTVPTELPDCVSRSEAEGAEGFSLLTL